MVKCVKKRVIVFVVQIIALWLVNYHASVLFSQDTKCNNNKNQCKSKKEGRGWVPIPLLLYLPESDLIMGGTVLFYFRLLDSDKKYRPATVQPMFVYTSKKQVASKIDASLYWDKDRYHFLGSLYYIDYPSSFYGIGNDTTNRKENYTRMFFGGSGSFRRRVLSKIYTGVTYKFDVSDVTEVDPVGKLASGNILGIGGGFSSSIGGLINWDSRDNTLSTSRGGLYEFSTDFYTSYLGSDYKFTNYYFDFRHFFPMFNNHVLGFQLFTKIKTGNPPFYNLSNLGGPKIMRGIFEGRYRDRCMVVLQTEYRFPIIWILEGVVFFGYGDVANKMDDFEMQDFKLTGGVGIHFMFERKEKVKLRLDLGYYEKLPQVYFMFLEAF